MCDKLLYDRNSLTCYEKNVKHSIQRAFALHIFKRQKQYFVNYPVFSSICHATSLFDESFGIV